MNAPQYGYQPYPAQREGIAIITQYSAIFSPLFATRKPKLLVDGAEMPVAGWGRADYTVDVPPGQFVELEYRAPLFSFSRGAPGPRPQRYPGAGAVIAFISICVLITVILLLVG